MERLQFTTINELQKYYRRAIVNNTYDLKSMQDAIQACLYHCSSTYQRPNHSRYPKGSLSWCCFNKGENASHVDHRFRELLRIAHAHFGFSISLSTGKCKRSPRQLPLFVVFLLTIFHSSE